MQPGRCILQWIPSLYHTPPFHRATTIWRQLLFVGKDLLGHADILLSKEVDAVKSMGSVREALFTGLRCAGARSVSILCAPSLHSISPAGFLCLFRAGYFPEHRSPTVWRINVGLQSHPRCEDVSQPTPRVERSMDLRTLRTKASLVLTRSCWPEQSSLILISTEKGLFLKNIARFNVEVFRRPGQGLFFLSLRVRLQRETVAVIRRLVPQIRLY